MKIRKIVFCFLIAIGVAGCTNPQQESKTGKPNIIIIMADDLGYSDLGCYGGEIHTPNLDGMASKGIRFTQFYNAARCCPTRASLLTGKYPHQVGLVFNGRTMSRNAATIAEVLKANGYHTGMAGKWHLSETRALDNNEEQLKWLAHQKDSSIFAPLESYPCNRGFEDHWGVIWGVVDYYDPFSLVHNEDAVKEVPDDFYITDFITDKSIELIDRFHKDDKPFFLYIAHNAPHWPLHALPEDIAKYKGVYGAGWDVLRKQRYDRMVKLGLVDPSIAPLAPNESGMFWNDCKDKAWESKHMEAHAAMVDRMDQGVGRVLQKLKETGEINNTLILFLADNGASPERGYPPGFDRPGQTREGEEIIYPNQKYDHPGPENTWRYIGKAWAGAINSPFRYWKKESFEGGNCTPLIVHWPAGLPERENTINNGVGHVIDILPTCMELAGTSYPDSINGLATTPIEGKSLIPLFKNEIKATHDTLFWEHEGGRALRIGDWKIAALQNHPWELFNLAKNRTETINLAEDFPDKVQEMESAWKKNYKRVYPKAKRN